MTIIEQLEQAEANATKGPWNGSLDYVTAIGTVEQDIALYVSPKDAEFIALCRNHIRALIEVAKSAKEYIEFDTQLEKNSLNKTVELETNLLNALAVLEQV